MSYKVTEGGKNYGTHATIKEAIDDFTLLLGRNEDEPVSDSVYELVGNVVEKEGSFKWPNCGVVTEITKEL